MQKQQLMPLLPWRVLEEAAVLAVRRRWATIVRRFRTRQRWGRSETDQSDRLQFRHLLASAGKRELRALRSNLGR